MKKKKLKLLILNKKSIVDLSNTVKIIGMGGKKTAPGDCVQNSHEPTACSDTVQSFCIAAAAGSCNGCPVTTGTIETNCCN